MYLYSLHFQTFTINSQKFYKVSGPMDLHSVLTNLGIFDTPNVVYNMTRTEKCHIANGVSNGVMRTAFIQGIGRHIYTFTGRDSRY